jgi:hypothetical protein
MRAAAGTASANVGFGLPSASTRFAASTLQ